MAPQERENLQTPLVHWGEHQDNRDAGVVNKLDGLLKDFGTVGTLHIEGQSAEARAASSGSSAKAKAADAEAEAEAEAEATEWDDHESWAGDGAAEQEETERFILHDYMQTFSVASTHRKTLLGERSLTHSDGSGGIPSTFVDDIARFRPDFKIDLNRENSVKTPSQWIDSFSSPNEVNKWMVFDIAQTRVSNMTAKGRIRSLKSLIIIGNGQGSAGYGVGKGETIMQANNRAVVNAKNNLIWLDLKDGRGLYKPIKGKHNSTKAFFWPRPHDMGHTVGPIMRAVCECLGLMDVTGKVIGRNNPYSVVQAIFDCFQGFQTDEQMALGRGRRLLDIHNISPKYSRDPFL